MNILLLVRSEILAVFILIFFIIYNHVCSKYREGKDYFRGLAWASLGHAVLGLITEITVNMKDFPVFWNNFFHILFFTFALLFSLKYFEYAISLIMPPRESRWCLILGYVLSAVFIVIMVISPIQYLQGNGTKYSAGPGPTLCYTLGFLLMLLSDILILLYRKKINALTVFLLIPLSVMTLLFMAVQIAIPEFLFTGCALSITVVGAFFAIENPIGKFQSRAFIDFDTRAWSKNCYDYDMGNVYANHSSDLIYILADINGLKSVNDTLGHLEGDALIKICADAMLHELKHAYKVYRIGGDEFAAVYLGTPSELVESEIKEVGKYCQEKSKDNRFTASLSLGYAKRRDGEPMDDVIRCADLKMYEEKNLYYQKNGLDRRRHGDTGNRQE